MMDTVTLKVSIAGDVAPGDREIRLAMPNGLSNPLRFCISDLREFSKPAAQAANPDLEKFIEKLGGKPEITRFKGLGEISPEEFGRFIGPEMKTTLMNLEQGDHIQQLLEYYMGKNTMERQEFIINNLKVELDKVEEEV